MAKKQINAQMRLTADTRDFQTKLEDAQKSWDDFRKDTQKPFRAGGRGRGRRGAGGGMMGGGMMGGRAGIAGAIIGAVGGVAFAGIRQTEDLNQRIQEIDRVLPGLGKNLKQFERAMAGTGGSAEDLADYLKEINLRYSEFEKFGDKADEFALLGLNRQQAGQLAREGIMAVNRDFQQRLAQMGPDQQRLLIDALASDVGFRARQGAGRLPGIMAADRSTLDVQGIQAGARRMGSIQAMPGNWADWVINQLLRNSTEQTDIMRKEQRKPGIRFRGW